MTQDHYVTAAYLAGFSPDEAATWSRESKAWVTRPHLGPRLQRVEKIGRRSRYMRLPDGSENPNVVDKSMTALETEAIPIIRGLHACPQVLGGPERARLAEFAALHGSRIPAIRNRVESFIAEVGRMQLDLLAATLGTMERVLVASGTSPADRATEDAEAAREFVRNGEFEIGVERGSDLGLVLDMTRWQTDLLLKMTWTLMVAPDTAQFIASDRPLVLVSPSLSPGGFYGPGYAYPDAEVTFPLTRTVCLVATWNPQAAALKQVTVDAVEEVNERTMAYASEFLVTAAPLTWMTPTGRQSAAGPRDG